LGICTGENQFWQRLVPHTSVRASTAWQDKHSLIFRISSAKGFSLEIHRIDKGLSRTRLDRSRGSRFWGKFRSFTPGDWSMHIKLQHNALSIERGGEESQPRPRQRWQYRRRKMRRRGWLRSGGGPGEGASDRQGVPCRSHRAAAGRASGSPP
jgi:hypothetical protein